MNRQYRSLPFAPGIPIPFMVCPPLASNPLPAKQDFICIPRSALVGANGSHIIAQLPLSDLLQMTDSGKVAIGYAISMKTDTFVPRPDDWSNTIVSDSDTEEEKPPPEIVPKALDPPKEIGYEPHSLIEE